MGYVVSQIEVTGTVEVTGSSRFDLPMYPGDSNIIVERVRFVAQGGNLIEIEASGPMYLKDGKIGRSIRSSAVSPPGEYDAEQHDASWDKIPVRLQQEILTATGVTL